MSLEKLNFSIRVKICVSYISLIWNNGSHLIDIYGDAIKDMTCCTRAHAYTVHLSYPIIFLL